MRQFFLSNRAAWLIAALLGASSVLGFAPFYIYPLPIAAVAGLLLLWQRAASPRQAAWLGFSFGLGLFVAGIYWIYISLHDFGGMPPLGAVFATFCLCAFMALFPALVGWLAKRSGRLLIVAPLLWALADWVRSWIFTGFPWLTLGYSQIPGSPLASFAPVLGIYGVSLAAASSAALLAGWPDKTMRHRLLIGLVLLWLTAGLLKLIDWGQPVGAPISVALVQGNIAQDLKWDAAQVQHTLDSYWQLTASTDAKLIVLPETALPMLLREIPPDYLDALTKHAVNQQGDLLMGTVESVEGHYYNSMVSLGSAASQHYRKSHLVPFGEFIPLKGIFGWVYRDWLHIPLTDLSRGGFDQQPLAIAGQRVAVNICYEDVFGEEIIRQLPQATLLVNASNDAWYGDSIAAWQHLQISQARAMETGRMMLRATNTGATAIIAANGELLAHAPHFTTTVLQGTAQGYAGATPYVRFGNWPVLALILVGLLMVLRKRRQMPGL